MNRTGLTIALLIAAVGGGIFAAFPELDIMLSSYFYRGSYGHWAATHSAGATQVRDLAAWLIALIVAPAVVALIVKLMLPRRPLFVPGRAIVLMVSTLALGPGIVANVILKDNWGRPRPFYITKFGGPETFLPWWDPRGPCRGNCSFVAGEPSGAFWTVAAAAVVPPAWRIGAYGAAVTFGAAVGVLRVSAGGHFVSDVLFAGVFMFLLIWLVHGLLYRWRSTRVSDAVLERWLERMATPAHDALMRFAARIRGAAPRG
jgi:lipid A 4'-phosphatase